MRVALLFLLGLVSCGGSSSTDETHADGGGGGGGTGGALGGSGGDGNTGGIEIDGGGGRVENPKCSGVIATTDPSALPSVPAGIDPDFVEWGSSPRVVVASNDEAIVAWSYDKSIRWRRYRAGAWLEREAVAGSEADPTLAGLVAASDGTVAAAYHEKTPGGYALCSRIARGDGTAASDTVDWTTNGWWQEPVPPVLALGIDGEGKLIAVYRRLESATKARIIARVAPSISWSDPVELGSENAALLKLAPRATSGADVLWAVPDPGDAVHAASLVADGWSTPTSFAATVSDMRLVADAADSTLALLVRWDGGHASVEAVSGQDSAFGNGTTLDEDLEVTALELATDGTGSAIASWQTTSGCLPTSFVSTRDSSGTWLPKLAVTGAALAGVATRPGQAALVLSQKVTTTSSGCVASGVQLHTLSTSGVSPTAVDASPDATHPAFAMAPDGRVLVAWSRGDVVVAKWLQPL